MSKALQRAAARLAAAQALYQMDVTGAPLPDVQREFEKHWIGQEVEGEQYNPAEIGLFRSILSGVLQDQVAIDRGIDATLAEGWPLTRVDALLRAILRAAYFELRSRPEIPARVAIQQYLDVTGAFYGSEESGLVNGVLNTLARKERPDNFA